jgi:two-component system OmpR family response regulator
VRILVVEDEVKMSALFRRGLTDEGMAVDVTDKGEDALWMAGSTDYDAIVLDVMLPGIDGFATCRKLRDDGVWSPVVMLTARDAVEDRVAGLDGGADDYLTKPFRVEELLARLRGLIRRASGRGATELRTGEIVLDPGQARVTVGGVPVRLTALEFRVFAYLMHQRGRVVSQSELVDHIYARDDDRDSNTVEVFVARLRRKLGASAIETVRGLGYRVGAPQ